MRFRYVFYASMACGFIVSFAVYLVLSGRQRDQTTILGSQDSAVVVSDASHKVLAPKTLVSDTGGYDITVPAEWTVDTSDPDFVSLSPADGAYTAVIDTVPAAIKETDRLKKIMSLEKTDVRANETVSQDPEKVGAGRLYEHSGYYFTETIPGVHGPRSVLSYLVAGGQDMFILSIYHPSEQSVARLRTLHDRVFSTFIVHGSPLSCEEGFVPFQHDRVWFCYPQELIFDASELPERFVFVSDAERLVVEPSSNQTWPTHLCNLNADIIVAGRKATRTIFREDTGAGCGAIIGFATRIENGTDKPWFIGLLSQSTTYPDESRFVTIEDSLHIE